jgi:hypothetical protein
MCRQPIKLWLFLTLLTLTARSPAGATPLEFTVDNLGGGLFRYDLTLNNQFSEPLSGLNVFRGYSVFGLDITSIIAAPAGWDFFGPFAPFGGRTELLLIVHCHGHPDRRLAGRVRLPKHDRSR